MGAPWGLVEPQASPFTTPQTSSVQSKGIFVPVAWKLDMNLNVFSCKFGTQEGRKDDGL